MPKIWWMALPGALVLAQTPPKTGMQFSEFYLHDPYIVAYKATRTYYLSVGAGSRQLGGQHAKVRGLAGTRRTEDEGVSQVVHVQVEPEWRRPLGHALHQRW